MLQATPAIARVQIGNHEGAPREAYGLNLSARRAQAFAAYLIRQRGVAAYRLDPVGFGADRPLADTRNPANFKKNMRTELTIERWWTTAPCPAGTTEPPATPCITADGEHILARPPRFQYDRGTLLPESFPDLDAVAALLLATPALARVEVVAYEVEPEDDARAARLSDRRARAVRDYLLQRGVPADRIDARGMPPSADATWLFIRRWGL
ncbi:MAG: OmpA family protein [bacterium]